MSNIDSSFTSNNNYKNNHVMISQGGEKKVMKKILSVALSTAMAFSMFASVAFGQSGLTDVNEQYNYLKDKGIFNGYTDGQAHLDRNMTRAEFAKVITKTLGLKEVEGVASFKDKNYSTKHWAAPFVEAVAKEGIMEGQNTTKKIFGLTSNVTVQEMATVLVRALKLEIPADSEINNTASAWAKGYVQAAINAGLVKADENFQANATRALLVSAAYAVDQKVSINVESYTVSEAGKVVEFKMSDGQVAKVTLDKALEMNKETEVKFTYKDKEYTHKVTYVVTDLAVESVNAINANQVLVKYNQPVEKTSAENLTNYLLEGKILTNDSSSAVNADLSTTATFTQTPKATLQADGKSVLITLDTVADATTQVLESQVKQKLTIENVKTEAGKEITKTATDFTLIDTTIPTVDSVTTEGNRVIVVKFSEFVKTAVATNPVNYQIDGVSLTAYGAGTGAYNAETNEVRFTLSSALADKSYKFKYSVNDAIVDAVGFKVVETVTDLTIKADTTVAKVASVEVVKPSNGSNYLLVKFTKPLAATSDYITGSPVLVDGKAYTTSVENGALKIVDANVTSNGAHAINIVNNSTNYLVDAYGIKVEAGSLTYTVESDSVKPTVTSTKVLDGNTQIEVKFSEKVDATTAQNRLNYTVKNASGTEQTIQSAAFKSGSQDTVVLTLSSALKAGTFSLTAKNVKDQASPANTMDAYTGSLTVVDTVKPNVAKVEYSGTTVYVTFSEDMNTSTITDKANYLFDNKALPSDAKVTAISNTVAKIEFATGTTVSGKKFAVSTGVKDVAGNQLSGFGYETTIADAFTVQSLDVDVTNGVNKVNATGKYTIEVTLNKALELLDAGEFEYSVDNGTTWIAFTQQNASFKTTDGKSTITFTLDKAAKGDGTKTVEELLHNVTGTTNIKIKTNFSGTSKTKATDGSTLAGTVLTTSGIQVNDKIAPAVELTSDWNATKETYNVEAKDSDSNGKVDEFVITFSEALKAGSVSKDDFAVTGLKVNDVEVASNVVTLKLEEGSVSDVADTIGVAIVGDVEDMAGNVLKADSNTTYYINQTIADAQKADVEAVNNALAAITTLSFDTTDTASSSTPKILVPATANGISYKFTAKGTAGTNGGDLTIDSSAGAYATVTRSTTTADVVTLTLTATKNNTTVTKVFNVTTSLTGTDVKVEVATK